MANPYTAQLPSPAKVAASLMPDPSYVPQYQLFLENTRMADEIENAMVASQASGIELDTEEALAGIASSRERARENLNNSYAARGIRKGSGLREKGLADQDKLFAEAEGRARSARARNLDAAYRDAARGQLNRFTSLTGNLLNTAVNQTTPSS